MNKELDQKLCEDFPEIFRDRHGNMQTTAMCWGFTCADGWEPLIRATCRQIMSPISRKREHIKHIESMLAQEDKSSWCEWTHATYTKDNIEATKAKLDELLTTVPVAVQVKEKLGGLRFYVHGGTDRDHQIIRNAESLSYYVCEECSVMAGVVTYHIGWIRTLCPACADKNYGTEAADFRNKTGEWAE